MAGFTMGFTIKTSKFPFKRIIQLRSVPALLPLRKNIIVNTSNCSSSSSFAFSSHYLSFTRKTHTSNSVNALCTVSSTEGVKQLQEERTARFLRITDASL